MILWVDIHRYLNSIIKINFVLFYFLNVSMREKTEYTALLCMPIAGGLSAPYL